MPSRKDPARRQKNMHLVILLSGGGFWGELKGILPTVTKGKSWTALIPEQNEALIDESGTERWHLVPSLVRKRDAGVNRSPIFWLKLIWRYYRLLRQEGPAAAIGLGANDCLPLAVACRLAGVPFVFIETVTRVDDLSSTGKWIHGMHLSKRFYVQWKSLADRYSAAIYKGIVHDLRHRRDNAF